MFFRNPWVQAAGILLVFAALAVLGDHFWRHLSTEKRKVLEKQTKRIETKIQKTLAEFPDLNPLEKDLENKSNQIHQLKETIRNWEGKMVGKDEWRPLLESTARASKENSLTIQEVSEKLALKGQPYFRKILTVGGRMYFGEAWAYLDFLERNATFLNTRSLTLARKGGDSLERPEFQAQIELLVSSKYPTKAQEKPQWKGISAWEGREPLFLTPPVPS